MDSHPIIVEQTYSASKAAVWRAITDRDQMVQWFFDTIRDFKAEVGFETEFTFNAEGVDYIHLWKVTAAEPELRMVQEWRYGGYAGQSTVSWEIDEVPAGTRLKLTHSGFEAYPQDIVAFQRASGLAGWTYFLQTSLKSYLEGLNE